MKEEELAKKARSILSGELPSPVQEGFATLHELYLMLRNGGFSQDEALWIVAFTLNYQITHQQNDTGESDD